MQQKITFIDNVEGLNSFDFKKLESTKVFSFNIIAHKFLEEKKIDHHIAEEYLKKDDREKIFNYAINLWNWHDNEIIKKEFEFENFNLLSIPDTSEFHQIIIREIFNFFVIKRVLEKEKPEKIILSRFFARIVKQIDNEVSLELSDEDEHEFHIQWEKMLIRFNILNRPVSIPISRKRYNQFKKIFESIVGTLFGLWQKPTSTKPSILFLEFNPAQYPTLLENLKNFDGNVIFFNRRRSAAWNLNSIKLLKKYHIKQISSDLVLSKTDNTKITDSEEYFTKKIDKFFSNKSVLSKIFQIEDRDFWPIVCDILHDTNKRRISEYLQLILTSKKILSQINVSSIISLNILGETEKAILAINDNKIPSILLEHGATNYLPSISKYDISNMYPIFRDKIALWGDIQKEYLTQHRKISADRIFLTGSPRHEEFFQKIKTIKKNTEKVILIAPQAMSEFNGLVDTNTYLRLEKLLVKIFQVTKNLDDIKVIVKMHPTLAPGNEFVKTLIHKLNPNVKILQLESVLDVIDSCDIMLNIHTELFPSTILYEGLILKKPVLHIRMMDEEYDFEFIKDKAVLSIPDTGDLEEPIKRILYDENFVSELNKNARNHLDRYFSNQHNASEELSKILLTFTKN